MTGTIGLAGQAQAGGAYDLQVVADPATVSPGYRFPLQRADTLALHADPADPDLFRPDQPQQPDVEFGGHAAGSRLRRVRQSLANDSEQLQRGASAR